MANVKKPRKDKAAESDTKVKKLGPFDFLNSINGGSRGDDMMECERGSVDDGAIVDSPKKAYSAFIINRGLSQHNDTVLLANEMNRFSHIDAVLQYDFLRFAIRPRKRYGSWAKRIDDNSEVVALLCRHYNCSTSLAETYASLYSKNDIEMLMAKYDQGGIKK